MASTGGGYHAAYRPTAFGAAGDGVADDTATIQAAIRACPAGGTVDGLGLTYEVTTLILKSDMTLENFNLRIATLTTDNVTPIRIGAHYDTATRSNITVRNVHIDGRRATQTNIGSAGQGGRHGIYVIGPVTNLVIEDSSAVSCGTDGLCIYGGIGMDVIRSTSTGISSGIAVTRCDFTGNRRHGVSMDSATDVTFTDCTLNDNGTDLGAAEGELGARYDGLLYGDGIDIEEHGGVLTYCADVTMTGCQAVRNASAGVWVFAGSHRADESGWVTRAGFTFDGCEVDNGASGVSLHSVSVSPQAANGSLGWYYSGVQVTDCQLAGIVNLRGVQSATHQGGTVTHPGTEYIGNATNSNVTVGPGIGSWYAGDGATVTYS